jgi:AraC-like DNA-binding protein
LETDGQEYQPKGHAIIFHPDLLHGAPLAQKISDYHFFGYNVNEALHMSEKERKIILECFSNIAMELKHNIDKHSKKLILSNIELLLNYCIRFYERQFTTREVVNKGIIEQFEKILNAYFSSESNRDVGLLSVAYCAEQLHLSPNYFGDLIKRETGISAKEYIQIKIIEMAKMKIHEPMTNINKIAFTLGFKYPQHFTRMFKKMTGYTPSEYRALN